MRVRVRWNELVTYEQIFDIPQAELSRAIEYGVMAEFLEDSIISDGDLAASFTGVQQREIECWSIL